jgi:hypothetical protein
MIITTISSSMSVKAGQLAVGSWQLAVGIFVASFVDCGDVNAEAQRRRGERVGVYNRFVASFVVSFVGALAHRAGVPALAGSKRGPSGPGTVVCGRYTGLKPLADFRLKGLDINSPRRPIRKTGKQEGACFSQEFPGFLIS